MTRLESFAQLVQPAQFNLGEACLMIAEDAYPGLDVSRYLARIDAMAQTVGERLAGDAFAEQKIAALNAYLFGELGLRGNVDDYYDPRNSYLHEVIERRVGIPITLSVLYIEVGRRLGLALEGVSFPGHFLVKLRVKRGHLVLDAFQQGAPQSEDDLRERLARALPRAAGRARTPPTEIGPYLEAATPRDIIARVLRNLKAVHFKANRLNEALAVMNRMLIVLPESAEERRDRGLVYARLDCFRPAAADLQEYLRRRPAAPDAQEIHAKLVEMTGAAARLN
jgi:regulator of sirC expression with transglutaminase-like and TPR domain